MKDPNSIFGIIGAIVTVAILIIMWIDDYKSNNHDKEEIKNRNLKDN